MNETAPFVLLKFMIAFHAETSHAAPYIIGASAAAARRELSSSEDCMNIQLLLVYVHIPMCKL